MAAAKSDGGITRWALTLTMMFCSQRVSETARSYKPFGTYHFIQGPKVHSLVGGTSLNPSSGRGRIGDTNYADAVETQLGGARLVAMVAVNGLQGGGLTDHSLTVSSAELMFLLDYGC